MDPGKVREPSKADEKQRSEKLLESPWGYERVSEAIEILGSKAIIGVSENQQRRRHANRNEDRHARTLQMA
jgi:hypothetical protein